MISQNKVDINSHLLKETVNDIHQCLEENGYEK